MPPWEQRLVSITAKWNGFSVTNAKGKCVLRYRPKGGTQEQVQLPQPLLYREEDESECITWCRAIYKAWNGGEQSLKAAFNEIAPKSTKRGEQHSTSWKEILQSYHDIRVPKSCTEATWKKNWLPFLEPAIKIMSGNKADNGYELLKQVLKGFKDAPTQQIAGARLLTRFMEFAVRRHGVDRAFLILEDDKLELLPKQPKKRKKAVIDDTDLLELIRIADAHAPGWGNVLRILTQYGLRPIEMEHLTVQKHPVTKKMSFWCSYEKVGGEDETEPRWLQPIFLRDSDGNCIQWDLEHKWHSKTLDLPSVSELNGGRINGFLHPKQGGKPKNEVEAFWLTLRKKHAAMTPTEWCRPYSLRDSYSVRSHREGVPEESICDAMGHSIEVHRRSYRTITNAIVARDYERDIPVLKDW